MAKRLILKKSDKVLDKAIFFQLFDDFINDSYSGKRLKKNGTKNKCRYNS